MEKNNRSTLKMHTALIPDAAEAGNTADPKKQVRAVRVRRASFSERMLRNTAVACALLLSVMALKNVRTPFTDKLTGAIRSVVNMSIGIDKSIGDMSFVQKMVPKSALVFLNMSPSSKTAIPVSGKLFHAYSADQPWTEFETAGEEDIFSLSSGTVRACVKTESGDWTILITHDDGTEAVYAYVMDPLVSSGDSVVRQDLIGRTGINENARLYLEYRSDGKPSDPSSLLVGYEK